ncbi:AraC family transcriptional regulator ligand-binding domain-containing protein [Cryomorphaceae bacterium 1068]|nr:AraC family transcriptional regulator ligand-binding domain-containing protein [Cryomorphaceae bacterium 1068]
MNYVSVHLYRKMLDCAIAEGIPREDFKDLPTPIDAIDQIQAIPADEFFAFHELMDQKLGPGFSVRVGQQMKIDDYGVLGLSWRTCSWVGEIFERSKRYFNLLSNTFFWRIEEIGGISRVHLDRELYRPGEGLSTEASLSATVVVMQQTSEKDIRPVEVSFRHKAPANLDSHNEAFQCKLLFEKDQYYIAYKTEDLKLRTARADEQINHYLLQRIDEETNSITISSSKIIPKIEELIRQALPSGIPSMDFLCEHLSMSRRTLTRRLSDNGVTFRDLIRNTQESIAKELLAKPEFNIGYIAFETGFSEQSAFNRAFKRWTGKSPLEFRKSS